MKLLSDFNKYTRSKDGLQFWCRECQHEKYVEKIEYNRERNRLWGITNRKRKLETNRRWCAANLERKRETSRKWKAKRYNTDPLFNLTVKLRRRIDTALRTRYEGKVKSDSAINLLGCTFSHFKEHIEQQFTDGMTWEKCFNGEIHLDHVVPCAAFDLSDPEQQRVCFGYQNIQPLWACDNLSKGARYER